MLIIILSTWLLLKGTHLGDTESKGHPKDYLITIKKGDSVSPTCITGMRDFRARNPRKQHGPLLAIPGFPGTPKPSRAAPNSGSKIGGPWEQTAVARFQAPYPVNLKFGDYCMPRGSDLQPMSQT